MNWMRRLIYNSWYCGNPPWESGIVPPEVEEFIQTHSPGRALDLGCGSGTSSIAFAKAGWQVTGVDFAWRAIRMAQRKAQAYNLEVNFLVGDIISFMRKSAIVRSHPSPAGVQYDLILDIGCFHNLRTNKRSDYLDLVASLLSPRAIWLVYGFINSDGKAGHGILERDLQNAAKILTLLRRTDGWDHHKNPSAWCWFESRK